MCRHPVTGDTLCRWLDQNFVRDHPTPRCRSNREEIPILVQQRTDFDLTVNLKTAKALGITVRRSILLRATEVIE